MNFRHSTKLFTAILLLSIFVLSFLTILGIKISLNGRVCNHSSAEVWLTVTEEGSKKAYLLSPGRCTDVRTQDAEAIWGRDCSTKPCTYQAWKVGAGHFQLEKDSDPRSGSGTVLRIKGWGAGSRWHITREWPRPDLSAIGYSLVH